MHGHRDGTQQTVPHGRIGSVLRRGLAAFLVLMCSTASSAWSCPMCKMALDTDDPQPRAYMISILFMLGMMGSVVAAVCVLLYRVNRAERRSLEAAGYAHLFHNGVNLSHGANGGPTPQLAPAE